MDEIIDEIINTITLRHVCKGRVFRVKGIADEIRIFNVNPELETASYILNNIEFWVGFNDLIGSKITPETFKYFKNVKCEEGKILLLARRGKPFLNLKLKNDGYYYFRFSKKDDPINDEYYKVKFWYVHQMQTYYLSHKNYELI